MIIRSLNLFCILIIFLFTNCNTTTTTNIPTATGKLCIYPERINGTLPESQTYFHTVYVKSGDILIQFDEQEKDCYYFTRLPVGKVFQFYSAANVNISEYRFKWKNDGSLTRGIHGKYNPKVPDKLEIKKSQLNFFGNYKLVLDYSEDKKESSPNWDVAGGRGGGAATILDASYEIIKLK
jgi:hypothetical protein